MKRTNIFISAFMLAAFAVAAAVVPGQSVSKPFEGFTLSDTAGKTRSYKELKGKNGAVVIFLSAQCPVVRGYAERINQLAAEYEAKGINFIGINSNATESLDWVRSNASEFGYKFPILLDKGNVLADKLGASVTPEVFYYGADDGLIYHGAIDNDRTGRSVSETYLKTAFDASLAGKPVARTKANAFGCSIKRVGD